MDTNTVEDKIIPGLQDQYILLAASNHDLESLRKLLRAGSANVQDSDTGFTPLHSAIAACAPSSPPSFSRIEIDPDNPPDDSSGGALERNSSSNIQDAASRTVKLLLENGAIWNDVDANNETPGCLARRLGLKDLYGIMVDAGVRAEMLLNRLDEYQMLGDLDDKEEEEGEEEEEERQEKSEKEDGKCEEGKVQEGPAEGERQVLAFPAPPLPCHDHNDYPNLTTYLASPLSIQPTRILDTALNGIMMSWETPLMERTAARLAPRPGLRILNIGHGMGIIDSFFQRTSPSAHHIIEAHPSILAHMHRRDNNNNPLWSASSSSSTITIHEGKWQDICPELIKQGELFDVIYFDTFAEDYKALKGFFSDYVIGLLDDEGRWGFFNGMGADRQICYDVYEKVVEMDLFEAGFDTDWSTVAIPHMNEDDGEGEGEWEGVRRKYWALGEYKLPVCRFLG